MGLKIMLLCSFFDIISKFVWFYVIENWRSNPRGQFLRSLGGKKYPKMPKNEKAVSAHFLCSLDMPRNHLLIHLILSIFKSISYRSYV